MANEFDGEKFGREVVEVIKTCLAGFEKRLAAIEARTLRYVGTYTDGKSYRPGEMCTLAGSLWHCETETTSRPGSDASWKLCVKRGEFSR